MKIKKNLIILFLSIGFVCSAQNKKAVKFFNAGKESFSNGNYTEAIESFTSAINKLATFPPPINDMVFMFPLSYLPLTFLGTT